MVQGALGSGVKDVGETERFAWQSDHHPSDARHETSIIEKHRPVGDLLIVFKSRGTRDLHMEQAMLLIAALEA